MKIDKILSLNQEIQDCLKTSPSTLLKNNPETKIPLPQLQCSMCDDMKKHNYQLKQ